MVDGSNWSDVETLLRENLTELAIEAIELAFSHGAVAVILAKLIQESTDIKLVGEIYNHFHNGPMGPGRLPKFPSGNVAFGKVAVAIGRKTLDFALAQPDLSRMRSGGALLFTNLANWHAIVGERDEAATVAREAVVFFSGGGTSENPEEIAGFAAALDTLLAVLRPLGFEQEAHEAGRTAIEHYRRLVSIDPAAYGPDLARTLVNWAGGLRGDGSLDVRLASYGEAAELYRAAHALGQRNFNPELCPTLIGFASVLVEAGRLDEALEAARKGSDIANALAGRRDASYGQLTVMATTNLALVRQRRGEVDEAEVAFGGAVGMARHLHQVYPNAFGELFARCLSMHALALVDKKDLERAFQQLDECVQVCCTPGCINDHVFLTDTYSNFAILAYQTARRERAMDGLTLARSALALISSAEPDWSAGRYETLRQLEVNIENRGGS